jgi:hypothetical protein
MKTVVYRVVGSSYIPITEIDISTDPVLIEQYGSEIPVLMIDETKVAKYRITEKDLALMLERRRATF